MKSILEQMRLENNIFKFNMNHKTTLNTIYGQITLRMKGIENMVSSAANFKFNSTASATK